MEQTRQDSPPVTDDLLRTALDIGAGLLRSGGEVKRVEDTITRICTCHGASHVEVFAITSLIIASVRMPDGSYSCQTRRILNSGIDLHKLDLYNSLSRDICGGRITLIEAQERLRVIKKSTPYPGWLRFVGALLGTAGFTIFFGGTLLDAIAAALIGCIMMMLELIRPRYVNSMAQAIISSFVGGILSILVMRAGLGDNVDKIMIGTIMILIPGLTIGTSIRDMLNGDTIAGFVRLLQSVLLATIIALGYGAAILLLGGLLA